MPAIKVPRVKLDPSYNPNTLINQRYANDGVTMTMLYYKEGIRNCEIKVTRREWDKLQPSEYLNDNLIWFWLKFYQYYVFQPATGQDPQSIYIFDTHFYSKMIGKSQEGFNSLSAQMGYGSMMGGFGSGG